MLLLYPSKEEALKIKRREYRKKSYAKRKDKEHEYYIKNAEMYKAYGKQWRKDNPDKVKKQRKQWQTRNPNTFKASVKKWQQHNKECVKLSVRRCHDKRYREMGTELINNWFDGCDMHHINKNQIICIPAELHRLQYHNHNKPNTMILVNRMAFSFLTSNIRNI